MLLLTHTEIRFLMGTSPVRARKRKEKAKDELGLWVDSALIARLHAQPLKSQNQLLVANSARMLLLADLAFGTAKPAKFKPEHVSKTRK